jgi:glutathione S-transferase
MSSSVPGPTSDVLLVPLISIAIDTCPFAQRTWIALLEKEDNPTSPVLFDLKLVNAYDKQPTTNAEFLSVTPQGMVPAALHKGNKFFNSLLLNEYVEEAINPRKSLFPRMYYNLHLLILMLYLV